MQMNLVLSSTSVKPFMKSAKHGTHSCSQLVNSMKEQWAKWGRPLKFIIICSPCQSLVGVQLLHWTCTILCRACPPPTHQAPCTTPLTVLPFLHSLHQPEQHTYVSTGLSCIWHSSSTPEPTEDEDITSQKTWILTVSLFYQHTAGLQLIIICQLDLTGIG